MTPRRRRSALVPSARGAPHRPDSAPGPRPSIQVRPARARDARAIAEIYNEAVRTSVATFDTEPRSVVAQRAWLRRHASRRHPVLVALRAEEVVGWASLSPWSDRRAYDATAEVSVYVARPHRGAGIGRRLLSALLRQGRRAGLHAILARVAGDNARSLRLHAAFAFEPVGVMREVGWKFGGWVDVSLLERRFGPRRRRAPARPSVLRRAEEHVPRTPRGAPRRAAPARSTS